MGSRRLATLLCGFLLGGFLLGVAGSCQRLAIDYEAWDASCASYCETRVECLDFVPWVVPDPPTDVDDCTQGCMDHPPENVECLEPETAYSNCLGALTCEELKTFFEDPFGEASRDLCFAEFEEASYCE